MLYAWFRRFYLLYMYKYSCVFARLVTDEDIVARRSEWGRGTGSTALRTADTCFKKAVVWFKFVSCANDAMVTGEGMCAVEHDKDALP